MKWFCYLGCKSQECEWGKINKQFCFENLQHCYDTCKELNANKTVNPQKPYGDVKDCNVQCYNPHLAQSGPNYFEADLIFTMVNLSIVYILMN